MTTYTVTSTPQQVASAGTRQAFTNTGSEPVVLVDQGTGHVEVLARGSVAAQAVFTPSGAVNAYTRSGSSTLDVTATPADAGLAGAGGVAVDDLSAGVLAAFSAQAAAAQAAAIAASAQALVPTAVKTADYTAAAGDFVPCDTTTPLTITLPTAPPDKTRIGVKVVVRGGSDAAPNAVTLACGGSDVFNKAGGATTFVMPFTNEGALLQYKASTAIWYVTAVDVPVSQLDLRYAGLLTPGAVQTTATAAVAARTNRYDATSGALAPAAPAVGAAGAVYEVTKTDATANNVTHGGETLAAQGDVCRFVSDGSAWISGGVRTTRANQTTTYAAKHAAVLRRIRLADSVVQVTPNAPTLAWSTDSGTSPLGSTAVRIPYNSTRVNCRGCIPSDNAGLSLRDNGVNSTAPPSSWSPEFDYYGSDFVYLFRSFDTVGGTYAIFVDGQAISSTIISPPSSLSVSVGGVYRLRITFGSTAMRRIRVFLYNAQYRGLEINPTDSVSATPSPPIRAVVYGDSFVGSALNIPQQYAFAETLGRTLDWDIYNCGQAGSAYCHGGSGNNVAYTTAARITAAAAANPDYVVIFGSVNEDSTVGGSSVVQTAAASVYSQFASAEPNAKLLVIGPPPQHTSIPAARSAAQVGVLAAAAAAPNVLGAIDPIAGLWYANNGRTGGDGQRWVIGTGWSTSLQGDGNADVVIGSDNVHPTQAGHDYFGRRIANDILDILAGA